MLIWNYFCTYFDLNTCSKKDQKIKPQPGQIIFGILISQSIMSLFIMFSQFYQVEDSIEQYIFTINERTCQLIAIPSLIASIIYNLLNILLIANLYCQIYAKNYNDFDIKKEIKIGIFVIALISLILVVAFDDLGISILGDCYLESQNVFATFLVYLRSILMIILSTMLIQLLKYPPEVLQTQIYKTVIDKFIKKYLQTYIKVNVTYGLLYVFARLLIPVVINYFQNDERLIIVCQFIQVIATLLMTIIRLHEPIIHRHVTYLFRPKKLVLQQRLLDKNKEERNDKIQESYDHIQIELKNNSISLSLESFQPLQYLPQESLFEDPQQQLKSIQHIGHDQLSLFLYASYEMFQDSNIVKIVK